ncbi:MAG TPA: hypothetical protein VFR86_02850 [Burkholderiaceae bacterium]|nr:hypothetical protein [Burkholderiaceae bacterium]
MATNPARRQVSTSKSSVIRWLLDSDPSIRWQVMRDLSDAPTDEVEAERARVATEGAGARLLALQAPDGRWGGAAWNRGWDSTMHVLSLLREMGLDPASDEARRAVGLVRDRVTWQGCGPPEADDNPFPTRWHYDVLRGLEYLRRAGVAPDKRVAEAIDVGASKRDDDGRWPLETQYAGKMPEHPARATSVGLVFSARLTQKTGAG